MTSKGATNRKWTSSDKYRESWERIFGGIEIIEDEHLPENVVLTCDRDNYYWANTYTGKTTVIKRSRLFDPKVYPDFVLDSIQKTQKAKIYTSGVTKIKPP